jgi:hypothetical protein
MSEVNVLILEKKKKKYELGCPLLVVLSLASLVLTIGAGMELGSYQILQELCYEGEEKKYYDPAHDRCHEYQRYYSEEDLSLEELRSLQDQWRRAQYIFGFLSIAGFLGAGLCVRKSMELGTEIEDVMQANERNRHEEKRNRLKSAKREKIRREEEVLHHNAEVEIKQKIDWANKLRDKGGLENLKKALNIYSKYGNDNRKLEIEIAKEKEKYLDYESALLDFENLGLHKSARRIRQKINEQKEIKVDQTVIHGDYVDDRDTIVKDSVINRSNIGAGSDDKVTKLEKISEMKEKGLIDDDEFKQMKKEILG